MLEGGPSWGPNPTSCQFCFLRSLNFLLFCRCMNWPGTGKVSKSQRRYAQAGWDGRDPRAGFLPQASSQDRFRVWSQDVPQPGGLRPKPAAAPTVPTQGPCQAPLSLSPPAARSGPPGSSPPAPTSKETRPKGSPSTAMSKNTVGLTMARQRRRLRGGGVCKAARAPPPSSFIVSSSPAYSRSRASSLANRNHGSVEMTAWLAYE